MNQLSWAKLLLISREINTFFTEVFGKADRKAFYYAVHAGTVSKRIDNLAAKIRIRYTARFFANSVLPRKLIYL